MEHKDRIALSFVNIVQVAGRHLEKVMLKGIDLPYAHVRYHRTRAVIRRQSFIRIPGRTSVKSNCKY